MVQEGCLLAELERVVARSEGVVEAPQAGVEGRVRRDALGERELRPVGVRGLQRAEVRREEFFAVARPAELERLLRGVRHLRSRGSSSLPTKQTPPI